MTQRFGVDLSGRSLYGRTLLYAAVGGQCKCDEIKNMIDWLIHDCNISINFADDNGETALDIAIGKKGEK